MGLHKTAHYLKTKGRGADTELVHMDKGELQALKGLAAKHGGNLTTNPETGLPEAGFLSSILPAVAGVATAALAPEMLPLVAGGIGLADYAMTGSLTNGLIAGMGAYGAGSMAGALETAGETQLAAQGGSDAVQKAALESGTKIAQGAEPGIETALNSQQIQAVNSINPTNFPNMSTDQLSQLRMDALNAQNPMDVVNSAGQGNFAQSSQVLNPTDMQRVSQMGSGLTAPGVYGSNWGKLAMASAPFLMNMQNNAAIPTSSSGKQNPFGLATLSPNFQGYTPSQPNPYYKAQYTDYSTGVGMAAGGSVPSYSGDSEYGSVVGITKATQDLEDLYSPHKAIDMPTSSAGIVQDTDPNTRNLDPYSAALYRLKQKASAAGMGNAAVSKGLAPVVTLGQINNSTSASQDYAIGGAVETMGQQNANSGVNNYYPQSQQDQTQFATPSQMPTSAMIVNSNRGPQTNAFAAGGITSGIGGYSDGGRMLKGPGDGMSDSIPATIGHKQPARLADGEFVVPADVVSHLGNGSTDAGAKRLYAMMDQIRKARTGRKKQAPAVKAEKYLPK